MATFILILCLMLLGYTFRKTQLFPKQTSDVLNLFVIYISLPAIILLEVPKIEFSSDVMVPIIIPWITTFLGALTILFFSKIFQLDKNTTGALLLVGILGNTSFLGIPVGSHYYGVQAIPYVMIYDQLGSFLLLSTYGAFVVAFYSDNSHIKVNASHIILKILKFPPFIALMAAFFLRGIEFNADLVNALNTLGNTLIPMALISVGFSLQLKLSRDEIKPFLIGLGTKLIIVPIYAFILVYFFGFEGLATDVSILESAMGPMITAGVVASMAGFAPKLTAAIVVELIKI